MRTFLFSIVIALLSVFSPELDAQNNPMVNYSGWMHTAQGQINYGVPSFYFAVFRSTYPVDKMGRYEYQCWFSSSSYIRDYHTNSDVLRPTYIFGIHLFVDGQLMNSYPVDISVTEARPLSSLTFYSANPNVKYNINWAGFKLL